MRIAFDAKRAFQNRTGLGHYSRTLISSLARDFPLNDYYLVAPKVTSLYDHARFSNVHTVTPTGLGKYFSSVWRSKGVCKDLEELEIDLYHGLSHEIPVGIEKTKLKSVVTIHDLIFERYPHQYNAVDSKIYRTKCKYACNHASRIIAISNQTKQDIISYYAIPGSRIDVCYQSCNEIYQRRVSDEEKQAMKAKYRLPDTFFLYVGSIIERKNLLTLCKALHILHSDSQLSVPLVVIGGSSSRYVQKVKDYIASRNMQQSVIFISDDTGFASDPGFTSSTDFPAIYQQALAMVYPSVFEGFGIPVLEALWSGLPVITSNTSCLPETGGEAALYVSPYNTEELAGAMRQVATDEALRATMIAKGLQQARKFTPERCAAAVMAVYESVMR